ncbi:MAG: type II secretion system minor pseudopilin GspH [Aeromonas sp.]
MRGLRYARGFTMLEMMLVAMLMGLMATGVTLSMGGAKGDRELEQQARSFMVRLQQAQEHSVMDGALLGLRIEENGWQFMRRDKTQASQWLAISDDKVLKAITLPEEMRLNLTLEGFDWLPENKESASDRPLDEKERAPQILIFPGGELSPFTLTFTQQDGDEEYRRLVLGDELGTLALRYGDEETAMALEPSL